ncbi:MAG: hypothetical protein A2Y33_08315 [Spirochaetes bacterium GWF1_51_8]|nr:MAG: hypothetical protein A2Y33_08315 [Spirochaetes bacterium GWF1_51_8]
MGSFKVLLVEDAVIDAEIVKNALGSGMFDLRILDSGYGFLSAVEEFNPDVIVLDLNLPDTNGIELCRKLKNDDNFAGIPVIMVTSEHDVNILQSAYLAGAWDYLKKPYNTMELLIRLENVLRLSGQNRELIRIKQDTTVSEMGRAIAHNFNQPLTTLLGTGELLLNYSNENPVDGRISEQIQAMIDAAREISTLVKKVERLKEYKVTDYIQDIKIIDLDQE